MQRRAGWKQHGTASNQILIRLGKHHVLCLFPLCTKQLNCVSDSLNTIALCTTFEAYIIWIFQLLHPINKYLVMSNFKKSANLVGVHCGFNWHFYIGILWKTKVNFNMVEFITFFFITYYFLFWLKEFLLQKMRYFSTLS